MLSAQASVMTALSRRTTAGISGVGLVALYALVQWVPIIGAADRSAFMGRLDGGTSLIGVERLALATITLLTLLVGLLVLTLYTARRQGVVPAVRLAGSVVGAAVSAELLKHVLPFHPTPTLTGQLSTSGSFPSGHSAIAAALALAVAATAGPRLARLWWGPLVAWVSLVAAGTVAVGWHRPSDAVGGVLLALVWHAALVRRPSIATSAAVVTREPNGRRAARGVPGWRWWAVMCVAILAGALAPRVGAHVELGDEAGRLYVLGLGAVLATTGALMLLGPQRVPLRSTAAAPRRHARGAS